MSRRKPTEVSSPLSLFPFIGVLLSTMGALLVVLVAVSRSAHNSAVRDVATKRTAIEAAPTSADAEEMTRKLEQVNTYAARLSEIQAEGQRRLRDDQLRLSHAEDHLRRLQDELVSLKVASNELDTVDKDHLDDRRQAEREVDRLRELIKETQATVQSLKESTATRKRSYAIIPYDGPNGTRRRPIYIECFKDKIVMQPEGITFTEQDFVPPLDSGNPLAAALRAAREQIVRESGATLPNKQAEPYPLILVRPEGVATYYAVREAIASWDADFGYEFVGEDWKLEYQPPNPQIARLAQQSVDQARLRRRVLAAAAPGAFRATSGFDAFDSDDDDDGGQMGDSDGRAVRGGSLRGSALSGGAGGGGGGGGAPAGPLHIATERNRPSGAKGGDAGSANEANPYRSDSAAQSGSSPTGSGPAQNGLASGSSTSGGSASGGAGDPSAAGGFSGGAPSGAGSTQTLQQGGAQSSPRASTAIGKPGQTHALPERITPQDMGHAKGGNWALGGKAANAVPVRRSIQVVVRDDRISLLSDSNDPNTGGHEVKLNGPTSRNIDEVVNAVQQHVGQWGMAGSGLYWRPVLVLNIGPDGTERANELAQLLKDSGIELRVAAVSPPPTPQEATRR